MSKMFGGSGVVAQYLLQSGLAETFEIHELEIQREILWLEHYLDESALPEACWQYLIPELGEGGACSLFGQLADEPYDLSLILNGRTAQNEQRLSQLQLFCQAFEARTGMEWFGIYQARKNPEGQPVLVKLAYYGAPSRPEFPLTAEFARMSNNSTVGITGLGRVINDIPEYLARGGDYYTCDPKVQAEACLPLFDHSGRIVGIIDAEAFQKNVFNPAVLALLVAVCLMVPAYLPAADQPCSD
ncbi:histidine kinase [Alkalimonas sp. MEB004]|uniref:Histidine kinase n=2 Tax=Alkalimonas mucilaginosa TaxID=3057676 RepID=A0ABU7JAD5_9GAMM|nr:histidine kinase [Alkalimonas sp. MEB004]MEE2022662.1 histidine kinase [Alkalimonas sp. MEB004]